ncbi:hypothetical protein [Pseudohaliea sp.]|uniref:hypothetical protein n=1 Tax=Pseudohaliea sp. TaxID=2740289 RepID=UPI0032ECEF16
MTMFRKACLPALVAAVLSATASAQDKTMLESDWLDLVRGHRGEKMGLEVKESRIDPETGKRHLVIAVPKVSVGNANVMEEVLVVGRRPERPDLLPDLEYEWVEDYDNDFYGLLVRFSEDQETPLRLYFSSEAGFLQP